MDSDQVEGTERAVLGPVSLAEARTFFDAYTARCLGGRIARVRFRSGRIDVVWGLDLEDGRAVVVKVHRPPVELEPLRAAVDAQRLLAEAGFPAPAPLCGPDEVDGHVVTAEALLDGEPPEGRSPAVRRLLAEGLVLHIALLRSRPDLADRAGPGPSWCRYADGPWPTPHDPIVDLTSTPAGYAWLDDLARRASDRILRDRPAGDLAVGHADWYAGNALVRGGALSGVFDWELVADAECVLAGFAAACFASSPTGGGGLSTPEEAGDFLRDYEAARGGSFAVAERRAAAGAVAWILAFNARWQVGLLPLGIADMGVVELVRSRRDDFLALQW